MYISLFFDVEDCVTPISDDIAKNLAEIVSEHGLVGNFMVAGNKARVLESRGRWDVIEALGRHEVGLHTNRHSRHPTVAEYLEDKGWSDGIEEVILREEPGVKTIKRLFGRLPACWAQSGGSWGPQAHPALKRLGVPIIVYPNTYTASSDIHWYGGALAFAFRHSFEGFDQLYSDDAKFQEIFQTFQTWVAQALEVGYHWLGVFCAHPIVVRAYEFGDVLNFSRGKETPPELWRQPPLKSEDEYRTALKNFAVLVKYIAEHPGLEAVAASDVARHFGRVCERISFDSLLGYASAARGADDIPTDDARLSPAEAVDVLVQAVLALSEGARPDDYAIRHVDGPTSMPPQSQAAIGLPWTAFRSGCASVKSFVDRTGQLPASIDLDGVTIGTGSFYFAACECLTVLATQRTPDEVTLRAGPQIPAIAEPIARNTEAWYRSWVIHKPNLNTTRLLELTRLQTWTLKPASYRGP
jgi:hypothetical protein